MLASFSPSAPFGLLLRCFALGRVGVRGSSWHCARCFCSFHWGVGNGRSGFGNSFTCFVDLIDHWGLFSRVVREWVGGATMGCKLLFV